MHQIECSQEELVNITPAMKHLLNDTRSRLKGTDRRQFMAHVVLLMGKGGQRRAERELGWTRDIIRKGMKELKSGIVCIDNFSGRGRKPVEEKLPSLLEDIKRIVDPICQTDPTFHSTRLYSPITAKEVRRRLIDINGYSEDEMPSVTTVNRKMNNLGFCLKKVAKCEPKKKIPEVNMIFEYVHNINALADATPGVLRLSMDAKAAIKVGPFSRGGYNRYGLRACDHDFEPDAVLKLFGIFLPATDEPFFYFTESNITADFIVDALEELWPQLKEKYAPHTLVLNLDNGPENSSRRSQFMNRLVKFAFKHSVNISLAYYPPYHSKYNPIERLWGRLEQYWNGEILGDIDKVLGLAKTMTWKGCRPVVQMIEKAYNKGVCLTKSGMKMIEDKIIRINGLEKWAVDIPCYPD